MKLFRTLNDAEAASLRKWARGNYKPYTQIDGTWHPVVQAECVQMNHEAEVARDEASRREAFLTTHMQDNKTGTERPGKGSL